MGAAAVALAVLAQQVGSTAWFKCVGQVGSQWRGIGTVWWLLLHQLLFYPISFPCYQQGTEHACDRNYFLPLTLEASELKFLKPVFTLS